MKLLIVFSLAFVLFYTQAVNPGLELRLSQAGLTYAKSVGIQILNEKASSLTIPDQSGSGSGYSYSLTSIHISQFNAPDAQSSIQTTSNGFHWSSAGITVNVAANYYVKVGYGWLSVSKSGSVTADGNSIGFDVSGQITDNNGHPGVSTTGANVNIGSLDVQFHGDMIDDIADLFSSQISDYVKGQLNSALQGVLSSLINNLANQELATIPISMQVYDGYSVDYSLVNNPTFTANYVELPMQGLVYEGSNQNIPVQPPAPTDPSDNSRMLYVMGTDYVLNTFGYATQQAGLLKYYLTAAALNTIVPGAGQYLATTCSDGECVGGIIAPIGTAYPNCNVEIQMTSSSAPYTQITTDGININFNGVADFNVRKQDNTLVEAFSADVTLSAILVGVSVQNYVISAQAHVTGATLTVTSSNVGTIDNDGLQQVWQLAMLGAIDGLLDQALAKGFPIPNIPYVKFVNPAITTAADTLIIATDVQYTGGL